MTKPLYRDEEGKIVVFVPVEYTVFNEVELRFDSVEEMKKALSDKEFIADMPLGDNPQYAEDSYRIDYEFLDEDVCEFLEQEKEEEKNYE